MIEQNTNKNRDKLSQSDEIDLKIFLKFLFLNKKIIGSFSLIFFLIASIFSLTLKRVYQGQFQIVLSSQENSQPVINPLLQTWLQPSLKSDLETQVGILESASVLMPIFDFVKEKKQSLNTKNQLLFSNWKNNLIIDLKGKTSILNIYYRDKQKDLIMPVLNKVSVAYQEYSESKKIRMQELTNTYLIEQISFYKNKSANSLRQAQEFAIDQNFNFNDLNLNIKNSNQLIQDDGENLIQNILIPNIDIESVRVNSVNELNRINSQLKKIEELADHFEKIQYIGSTIPAIVDENLPFRLAEIEQELANMRTKYTEKDRSIRNLIEEREILIEVLKKRSIGYLNARKLQVEAKLEAANRPKGVLLKYKELVREAQRDELTLINLENKLRALELERARDKDPWELITKPTLLEFPVAPDRKIIAIVGLFFGAVFGTSFQLYRENKSDLFKFFKE